MSAARRFQSSGALLLAIATIIGALGAHALKTRLPADRLEVLQTGVHYQFFHALGLLLIGLLVERSDNRLLAGAGNLVLVGILLFSGSLYVLLLPGVSRWIGVVTPVGGVCLIAGWLVAAWALWRRRI
ncbi:MAG: DUF423 domain-containing protein [Steroidobacteraceae bacterium]